MKILIAGACAVTGRSIARSLQISKVFGDDLELIGTDISVNMYGFYEKLYKKIYIMPKGFGEDYDTMINGIIKRENIDAAIVVPEREVMHWAEHSFPVPYLVPDIKFCDIAISKERLFELLKDTDWIPKSQKLCKELLEDKSFTKNLQYPLWIRDASDGTASGKGAFKANCIDDIRAWMLINKTSEHFQISEFLPGKNYGCFCLYKNGELKKVAVAERIEYLMSKIAVSGITGNTCKGKLLNDKKVSNLAQQVVKFVCDHTNTVMNGMIVVDMKADAEGNPKVTEINIRHVAFSSSFANAGFNMAEFHLLCALNRENELSPELEKQYPVTNLILRDVDGLPIYIEETKPLTPGSCFCYE
ncbi:hypothetical protein [Bacteroides ovatus]|uniref:hypothetical protein n=1 Tax=Bacteroides ovatus TaxID=28116 RepID=UPI001F2541CB|nr:hypothetical protein [Bacteroides ovatus]MCE8924280.1 hypothetical protein [Bacteroides ovatus]